jgi:hypothetical protein
MSSINKNKQFYFEYAMNSTETWEMICFCNLSKCRKQVSGNFFDLPLELQKKYQPYVHNWFVSKFQEKLQQLS